jgi:hypothetical protein
MKIVTNWNYWLIESGTHGKNPGTPRIARAEHDIAGSHA